MAPPTWAPWTWAPTVPYPTHSPTVSKAPVTPPCTGSTPNWKDWAGDGCEWYEANDTPGCPLYDTGMIMQMKMAQPMITAATV